MTDILHILLLSFLVVIIGGCTTLKSDPHRNVSHTLAPTKSGILADTVGKLDLQAGDSAAMLLTGAKEAMDWRLALIDHAIRSIDIQYFIWSSDEAGMLMFDRLLKAADRGVRVRLLVDDMALDGSDHNIAVYSHHPNLEIRIYNPGLVRKSALGGIGEFMLFFRELNRRMHNKLFVVDNNIAILGGRNIGNPYFGLSDKYNNQDLDLLLAGAAVTEISKAFDDYWNAELAYPGVAMSDKASILQLPDLRHQIGDYLQEHKQRLSSYPLQVKDWQVLFEGLPERMDTGKGYFLHYYTR